MRRIGYDVAWLATFIGFFVWSLINPYDYTTWLLEMFPVVLAVIILVSISCRFRFTRLVEVLILLHCVVLIVGAHYTYAQVPFFNTLKDVFGWSRNNYDKLGHLFQGFVPALIVREILVRNKVVTKKKWLAVLSVSTALAISAAYELFEWTMAVVFGGSVDAFLGTQGYQWDTQSDMAFALGGAIIAIVSLGHWQDQQIQRSIKPLCSQKKFAGLPK